MRTYTPDSIRVSIHLARTRARQLRVHVKWLDKAVGPASYQMRQDMDSAACRLEIMADMLEAKRDDDGA